MTLKAIFQAQSLLVYHMRPYLLHATEKYIHCSGVIMLPCMCVMPALSAVPIHSFTLSDQHEQNFISEQTYRRPLSTLVLNLEMPIRSSRFLNNYHPFLLIRFFNSSSISWLGEIHLHGLTRPSALGFPSLGFTVINAGQLHFLNSRVPSTHRFIAVLLIPSPFSSPGFLNLSNNLSKLIEIRCFILQTNLNIQSNG
jgi:hypothetical protein